MWIACAMIVLTGLMKMSIWTPGIAPKGNYKVYVKYYGDCDNSNATSDYTLRIMNNSTIIKTYNGTLSPSNTKSPVYTLIFNKLILNYFN